MDVDELKLKVKAAYRSFTSYEDSGIIRTNNFGRGDGWFKTEFLRPNLLKFEWCPSSHEEDRGGLFVRGDKARIRLSRSESEPGKRFKQFTKLEEVTSVHMAMSMTGGGSFGMTDSILPMLLTGANRPCFTRDKTKAALLRDEVIDGEPCYHIREIYQGFHIRISKNDFTVRRTQSDGCAPLNEMMRGYMSAVFGFANLVSRSNKTIPEGMLSSLENPTDADWRFQNVRYNHLSEEHFKSFSLEDEASTSA